eukprot:11161030-Lingulodinium_polyedra.AAC.1
MSVQPDMANTPSMPPPSNGRLKIAHRQTWGTPKRPQPRNGNHNEPGVVLRHARTFGPTIEVDDPQRTPLAN